jgi:hypothetical protein
MEQIADANKKVNRALAASAAAMGGNVRITDMCGYMPRLNGSDYMEVFTEAMGHVLQTVKMNPAGWGTGCSDMGDIASLMPAIHPYVGGASGSGHGNDFYITDPDTAVVDSAKVQLLALKLLLENGAVKAKEIVANYKPVFENKEAYFAYVDALDKDVLAVTYGEDGSVKLNY